MRSPRALAPLLLLSLGAAAPPDKGAAPAIDLVPVGFILETLYEGALAGPRDVFVDRAHGEVLVADTRNHRIDLFTLDGVPIFSFGSPALFREPARVCVDPAGRILVLDNDRSAVKVFSYRGEALGTLPLPGAPRSLRIGALAFDAQQNLYVGDNASGQVLVWDAARRLRRKFGAPGAGEGQFKSIAGIVADEKNVFVIDHLAIAVQRFDRHGNFERGWGAHDMGAWNFSLPQAIVLDREGRVLVSDGLRHDVKAFDREGRFLGQFGGFGSGPGNLAFPDGLAIAGDRLYVAEHGGDRVQAFRIARPRVESPRQRRAR